MENIEHLPMPVPPSFEEVHEPRPEPQGDYTPGDFLWQFGALMAFCLGLALLAHFAVFLGGN